MRPSRAINNSATAITFRIQPASLQIGEFIAFIIKDSIKIIPKMISFEGMRTMMQLGEI